MFICHERMWNKENVKKQSESPEFPTGIEPIASQSQIPLSYEGKYNLGMITGVFLLSPPPPPPPPPRMGC